MMRKNVTDNVNENIRKGSSVSRKEALTTYFTKPLITVDTPESIAKRYLPVSVLSRHIEDFMREEHGEGWITVNEEISDESNSLLIMKEQYYEKYLHYQGFYKSHDCRLSTILPLIRMLKHSSYEKIIIKQKRDALIFCIFLWTILFIFLGIGSLLLRIEFDLLGIAFIISFSLLNLFLIHAYKHDIEDLLREELVRDILNKKFQYILGQIFLQAVDKISDTKVIEEKEGIHEQKKIEL
jgi:hypothetical protein